VPGPCDQPSWYLAAHAHIPAISSHDGMRMRGVLASLCRNAVARLFRITVFATMSSQRAGEAANRGAADASAPSIGFNIGLPHEQEPNAYSTPDLTFQFHYFAVRKLHFAIRANALVVFPGGFGTLDELFELLTLIQTHKMPPVPVVLVDQSYWTRIVNFEALAADGMIDPADLNLFTFANDSEEAWHKLVKRGLRVGTRPRGYPSKFR